MYHHHIDSFGFPRSCQFQTITVRRIPPKQTNSQPSVHVGTRHQRIRRAQKRPRFGFLENNHCIVPNFTGCITYRSLIKACNQ
ncbi:hypothetical protein Goshw_008116 [Gossypium schwendimanii]|uniref:Uncharacterized protein n=1 Tax=Gossypium schwendimanii TaxID=34291 RepID=A0A7J9NCY4_GOSSC|nr:hypothetical protein [Gossypium schwendimanii]